MPTAFSADPLSLLPNSTHSSFDLPTGKPNDKTISGVFTYTNGTDVGTGLPDHRLEQIKSIRGGSQNSLTTTGINGMRRDRAPSYTGSTRSLSSKDIKKDFFGRTSVDAPTRLTNVEQVSDAPRMNGTAEPSTRTQSENGYEWTDGTRSDGRSSKIVSSPPPMTPVTSNEPQVEPIKTEQPRLSQRHTLSIPQSTTGVARASREFSYTSGPSEEVLSSSGRFSPTRDQDGNTVRRRRASLGLARRSTRATSDAHLEEVQPDEDAARWTEAIKQKRASRRRRQEEDDDRVIVGKKVEEGHVNWVTAYNMLTGIRFTVSRTNAKMDRELTDADFDAKHKFSFDVTGSELTPSAKYDFKFKDYSPWVFRHLRQDFGLDPADYLMSLTSKYILSELGSPGKSGSFFYFSRDYKYIIKTIHHAEHKLLRKILREYYGHVRNNPNTLISQFYGLHRVKIAYGRKIHFVVMNNLFPPHRDIHQTFDLKGSTIGRDFKEENLASNPRATLKDLNWLRRDMHLEFDQRLREVFIAQLQKDVALLQRLQIMDYSLLVGMHDLEKGNDENVREATLQVFQPGGERDEEDLPSHLMRTPSRLESTRKARALRATLKKEKPVPMGRSTAKMPESMGEADQRHQRVFYSDDGGIRATHEDGRPGEMIYYLGVIDCLTHYGFIKRVEHFWKGMSNNRHQISPIPPQAYGERFLNFMTGITMSKEEAERRAQQGGRQSEVTAHNIIHHHHIPEKLSVEVAPHSPRDDCAVEKTLDAAQKSTDDQTGKEGRRRSEEEKPDRTLHTRSEPHEGRMSTALPIVQEAGENGSRGSSHHSSRNRLPDHSQMDGNTLKVEPQRTHMDHLARTDEQPVSAEIDDSRHRQIDGDTQPDHHPERTKKYAVTVEDEDGHDKDTIEAPLSGEQIDGDADTTYNRRVTGEVDGSKRVSKPPRLNSGIIPTLDPMYREDEIGVAK